MLTIREASTVLDVSRPTVMRWIQDGSLPGAVLVSQAEGYQIPEAAVTAKRQELIAELERQIRRLERLGELVLE